MVLYEIGLYNVGRCFSAVQLFQKAFQTSAVPNGLAGSPTAVGEELHRLALVGELYSGAVSVGYLIAPFFKLCNRVGYALRFKPCLSLCVKSCHSFSLFLLALAQIALRKHRDMRCNHPLRYSPGLSQGLPGACRNSAVGAIS